MRKLILFTVVLLAACAAPKRNANEQAQRWVGRPEADLVRHAGTPTSVYTTGDSKFLTYSRSRSAIIDGGLVNPLVTTTCTGTFEVRNGVVVGATVKGQC